MYLFEFFAKAFQPLNMVILLYLAVNSKDFPPRAFRIQMIN